MTLGLTKEAPLGSHVGLSVVTYKDLRVVDPAFVIHDNLQQTTGLKEITPVSFRFMDDDWGADCEDWYYPHLDEMGIDYEPCELGGEGGGLFSYGFIGDYDVTIWVTGNTDMVLHPKDLDFIEMYLDRGHGLLFISRDVGWQMDYWGASGKLEKLLDAEFVLDSSGATMVEGIDGDPVTDGLSNLKITGGYDKTQGKYDQLNPIAGASSILTYADGSGGSAGLRWEGNASHLILLQFPVESMELYDERQLLLERCIDWVAYD